MNKEIYALLIFCEGPHDVAFARKALKALGSYRISTEKFSKLPYPFDKLLQTVMQKHASNDMALSDAHSFFLPTSILRKDHNNDAEIICLFNCGGVDRQCKKAKEYIEDFLKMLKDRYGSFLEPENGRVSSVKYLFVRDADEQGISNAKEKIASEIKEIDRTVFFAAEWMNSKSKFGCIAKDKAVFVLGETHEQGTLEDVLWPMFPEELRGKAESAMKAMFSWDATVSEQAKYKKAAMTTIGQREDPGASFNAVLEHSELIESRYSTSKVAQEFVSFVKEFLKNERTEPQNAAAASHDPMAGTP